MLEGHHNGNCGSEIGGFGGAGGSNCIVPVGAGHDYFVVGKLLLFDYGEFHGFGIVEFQCLLWVGIVAEEPLGDFQDVFARNCYRRSEIEFKDITVQ